MTKIQRVEFQPEHIMLIKVDPIVKKLRGDADMLEWARIRKLQGVSVSMEAVIPEGRNLIVACGGFLQLWPGMAELWMTLDVKGAKMPALPIAIRNQMDEWVETHNLGRVQSTVAAEWEAGIHFLEWLGMEKETVLRRFGPGGIDQILYARVK